MNRSILTNATLILPDRVAAGSLILEDDRIAEVSPGRTYREGLDLSGQFLMPGLIDIHTDYLEREIHPRPSAAFPLDLAFHYMDLRAIGCGVTTVLGAVRFASYDRSTGATGVPDDSGLALAESLAELRKTALARHLSHVRWDPAFEPAEPVLRRLLSLECAGNLVYNDATPGERQFRNVNIAEKWAAQMNITIQEARTRLEARIAAAKALDNRETVRRLVAGRIPIGSHDDTTVGHVEEAFHHGATLSEMPCTIEAARRAKELGMFVCMGAPNYYRGGSHCGNLSCEEALGENLVDILCSDFHFPSLLAGVLRMAGAGTPLHEAARLVTGNPATHLRMDQDVGSIEAGRKGDLIAFSADRAFGVVSRAWVNGQLRFRQTFS